MRIKIKVLYKLCMISLTLYLLYTTTMKVNKFLHPGKNFLLNLLKNTVEFGFKPRNIIEPLHIPVHKNDTWDNTVVKRSPSFNESCFTTLNLSVTPFSFKEQNFDFLETEEGQNYKKILFYSHAFGKRFGFGFGKRPFEAACCKEKRCFTTNRRDQIRLQDFDAVLIHFRNIEIKNYFQQRSKNQRWILFEREPPTYSFRYPQVFNGVFNWTMTYRRDSDVNVGYGNIYKKADFSVNNFGIFENFSRSLNSVMKTKKGMAAWMVSNCKTPSRREVYVKQLQQYIEIDIFGECGPLKCEKKNNRKCLKFLEENYKFYLAFENSFCKDYISEKFFRLLSYNIIPVVRGGANYASLAPPHSYIDVDDFKTPKELANYLLYLDENDTAYEEYFMWKETYIVINSLSWLYRATGFCDLCEKLHTDKEVKIYYDLKEWFIEKANCTVKNISET
ncbi:UNVERIFIED_CONTAM: hypothetical protein RMT77_007302 [Armadillidium vulgare]